jgi:Mg2+ and Co2+ transporter CorA
MLMKFDSRILHYYIKLENLFMKYLEMLEKKSDVMQKLIASFSEEIKKKDEDIQNHIQRNNYLEDLDSYHTIPATAYDATVVTARRICTPVSRTISSMDNRNPYINIFLYMGPVFGLLGWNII